MCGMCMYVYEWYVYVWYVYVFVFVWHVDV